MKPNASSEVLSKSFAYELALAIEASCLTYRDYIPWADNLISQLDHPPLWICDLSTIKYRPDALRVIHDFVHSEPFEQFDTLREEYICFLWIRYERRELSWASFLKEAGEYSDRMNTNIDCEYFYSMLNELEEAEFNASVEDSQRKIVGLRLADSISKTQMFYARFQEKS